MDSDHSDESCFSDEEGASFQDGVQAYRFEPKYTEEKLQVRAAHSHENTVTNDSFSDMSWCECGHCTNNTNIDEKICCKNPMLLDHDDFENLNCIAQTTSFRIETF